MWSPNPHANDSSGEPTGSVHPPLPDEKRRRKRKKETVKSLRKKKKTPALRQLLDSFPRRKPEAAGSQSQVTDIEAIHWTDTEASGEESIYQSRKVIVSRQNQAGRRFRKSEAERQLLDADADADDGCGSETDSWNLFEAEFHEIYEPLPGHVEMDSWRSMSKQEMIRTVSSRRMKAEFQYMSRADILAAIETMKMEKHPHPEPEVEEKKKSRSKHIRTEKKHSRKQQPADYTEERPKQPEKKTFLTEMEGRKTASDPSIRKPDYSQHTYENIPVPVSYRGRSLAEIYQAKMEIRRKQALFHQRIQPSGIPQDASAGLYVTQAVIHQRPKHLISDSEATLKPEAPGRAGSIWRHRKDSVSSDIRSIGGSDSACSDCCSGCDDCSSCSCSSCDSASTIRCRKPEADAEAQPAVKNFVQQRRMEIEKEQEIRLKDLIRRQDPSAAAAAAGSRKSSATDWAALAIRNQNIRNQIYRPVSYPKTPTTLRIKTNSGGLKSKAEVKPEAPEAKTGRRSQKRAEIVQKLKEQMKRNLAAEADPEVRKRRHKELKQLLNVTMDAGNRTLHNINVGLIYVPMVRPEDLNKAEESQPEASASHSASGSTSGSTSLDENCDDDALGSIDTLIFEPKSPTPEAPEVTTTSPEEVAKLQEKINAQFDYLNDSEYNDPLDTSGSSSSSSSSGSESGSTSTLTKNLKMAAPALVPVTQVPEVKGREREEEGGTSSAAVAACCSVSACDEPHPHPEALPESGESDTGSEAGSFSSVIDIGRRLLHLATLQQASPLPASLLNWNPESGSEHYAEVADTDASWDYMDAADGLSEGCSDNIRTSAEPLLVGNLRKRPTSGGRSGLSPEADEAVRMLEALRMAEESNDSISLQLLFPSLGRNPEPLTSGFRSLPDLPPKAEEAPVAAAAAGKVSAGIRKRETMMRELKLKLRDKFRFNSGSKIKNPEEPFRSEPELDYDPITYNVPSGGLHSTGYPHHLWPRISTIPEFAEFTESGSEPTTIYDPSLPDDVPQFPYVGYNPHNGYPVDLFNLFPESGRCYPPEGLYGISAPLDAVAEETQQQRTQQRRRKKKKDGTRKQETSWRIDHHPLPADENQWLFWNEQERWIEQERRRQLLLADALGIFWDS